MENIDTYYNNEIEKNRLNFSNRTFNREVAQFKMQLTILVVYSVTKAERSVSKQGELQPRCHSKARSPSRTKSAHVALVVIGALCLDVCMHRDSMCSQDGLAAFTAIAFTMSVVLHGSTSSSISLPSLPPSFHF